MERETSSKILAIPAWFCCMMMISSVSAAETGINVNRSLERTEDWDRQVDQVALGSQDAAIKKLKKLAKKYTNSREEAGLLMRLAEVYQESAAIEFRITYAKAHQKKAVVNLDKNRAIFKSQIEVLDRLIKAYPQFYTIDQALYMRGKAHEELELKEKAKSDYLALVKGHPQSSRAISAYMALAEMAITNNQHAEAVSYLKQVEKDPGNNFYPFAIYKMAWSYFNLKDIPSALAYCERHIKFYDTLKEKLKNLPAADVAIRENSLMDSVVFFIEGNEQSPDRYKLTDTYEYLKKLEKGPLLGRMLLRFAKLLRSHRRDGDMITWKNQLLKEEKHRPETMEVVMNLLEHQTNQNQFDEMIVTLADITALHQSNDLSVRESESYTNARKDLSEAAIQLQARLSKAKNTMEAPKFLKALSTIYTVFINIVPETDPRVAQAHYNLAEILFQAKDFEKATEHYGWVIAHWNEKSGLKKIDIRLKAIASRYEVLRLGNLIPTELAPLPLDQVKDEEWSRKLAKPAYEWITWVDILSHEPQVANESLDNFEFDANRMIYANASTRVATQRLIELSLRKPLSKFAVPSATLAIDTYIKTGNWSQSYHLAVQLLSTKWNNPAFTERLTGVAADSAYKIAETSFQAKDYAQAIIQAKALLDGFPKTARAADGLLLTAQSYLAIHQKDTAQVYFSRLIKEFPESKGRDVALLNRAQLSEESYDLNQAIKDYKIYLVAMTTASKAQSAQEIQKRIYFLQWLNGEMEFQCESPLSKDEASRESLLIECQRYVALGILRQDPKTFKIDPAHVEKYFDRALKGVKENRVVWSAVVLKFDADIQLQDQLSLLRNVSKGWEGLEPLVRISLVPVVSSLLPGAFAKARANLKKEVPLNKASAKAITRRAEWIKEYESVASSTLGLPWNRIRAGVLRELSGVYFDFSSTLANLAIPTEMDAAETLEYTKGVQDIVKPFLAKSQDIAEKAYQLASISAVEDEVLKPIEEGSVISLQKQTQLLQKNLPGWKMDTPVASLDLNILRLINPAFDPNHPRNL